jgi:chitinase
MFPQKSRFWLSLLSLAFFLTSCGATPMPPTASAPQPTSTAEPSTPLPSATAEPSPTPGARLDGFRIVGYATDGDSIPALIQFDKLTHINYAFLLPKVDGTFDDVPNAWRMKDIVAQAHAHGVKVLISVGGWGLDAQFEAFAARPETRSAFVEALRRYVQDYALDGADIDWEYPNVGASSQNYLALMKELRAALPPGDKLLTSAVGAYSPGADGIPTEVFDVVDFLNLMAYDGPGVNHSSYDFAEESLSYWSARGLPREKTVLGVPFYSRPSEATYRQLMKTDPGAAYSDEVEYAGHKNYYNGIPTLVQKTNLALRRASGIMIWALSFDTNDSASLLNAIYQTAAGQPPALPTTNP